MRVINNINPFAFSYAYNPYYYMYPFYSPGYPYTQQQTINQWPFGHIQTGQIITAGQVVTPGQIISPAQLAVPHAFPGIHAQAPHAQAPHIQVRA